jgi:NhaP-type Na+/H+ or K+/H+ antiporter
MSLAVVFVVLVLAYSLISRRLERVIFTAPILFTSAGMLTVILGPELRSHHGGLELFLKVAELGLVLLLFTDASRTDLGVLRSIRNVPARLLSTGMLLTILLGAAAAKLVFPALSWWEAGILASILAPTDAGLGQIIVNSPLVPMKIRQALNVEAGLNDGLSVPFLLFFIALAGGGAAEGHERLFTFIVEQLGYGALLGIGIGLIGGWMLGIAHRRGWVAHAWLPLGVVMLPVLYWLLSESIGASMFIAAFVGGLAVQIGFKDVAKQSVEFTEGWGQLFNLAVFFLFGMKVAQAWPQFGWDHVVYAILSLTVIRMLPVSIALAGTGLSRVTRVFMGWFGPRGLASIVLGLVYLEEAGGRAVGSAIPLAVMVAVLASIFAHGLSALPGMEMYARAVRAMPPDAPELQSNGTDADRKTVDSNIASKSV